MAGAISARTNAPAERQRPVALNRFSRQGMAGSKHIPLLASPTRETRFA